MEVSKIGKKQSGGSARSGSRSSRASRALRGSRVTRSPHSSRRSGTPVAGGSGQPASTNNSERPSSSAAGSPEQPSTPVAGGSEQPGPHIASGSEEANPSAETLEHPDPHTADAGVQTTPPTAIYRNFTPEFWDELSRVWLTRRLVKEVRHRNYMDVPPIYERPPGRITLARFARHGGPDLRHLRNVSTAPPLL